MAFDFVGAAQAVGSIGGLVDSFLNRRQNRKRDEQQQANIEWQQQFAEEGRAREDTAVQRKAADMEAAGFHPTLALGGGGAGGGGGGGGAASAGDAGGRDMSAMEQAKMGAMVAQSIQETRYKQAATKASQQQLKHDTRMQEIEYLEARRNYERDKGQYEISRLIQQIEEGYYQIDWSNLRNQELRLMIEDLEGRMQEGEERHRQDMANQRQSYRHAANEESRRQQAFRQEYAILQAEAQMALNDATAIIPGLSRDMVKAQMNAGGGIGAFLTRMEQELRNRNTPQPRNFDHSMTRLYNAFSAATRFSDNHRQMY